MGIESSDYYIIESLKKLTELWVFAFSNDSILLIRIWNPPAIGP
jgi:hypothetical protein